MQAPKAQGAYPAYSGSGPYVSKSQESTCGCDSGCVVAQEAKPSYWKSHTAGPYAAIHGANSAAYGP